MSGASGRRRTPEMERLAAETAAWKSLARYKFVMFGYWAAVWVHCNRMCRVPLPNPWFRLVQIARQVVRAKYDFLADDEEAA